VTDIGFLIISHIAAFIFGCALTHFIDQPKRNKRGQFTK
jgi:hypothetical protein